MSKAAKLKHATEAAREYVGKIGRAQHHFRDGSVGKLCLLDVSTKISHQETTSATNYWEDEAFDAALSKVVSARFAELSAAALVLMEQEFKAARIAEKEALLASLAEIEALEDEATLAHYQGMAREAELAGRN